MTELFHISTDNILDGWKSSCTHKDPEGDCIDECSIGRVAQWGAHYIAIIHDDVPEGEREELAKFIANAPEQIKLKDKHLDLNEAAMFKMKDEIGVLKAKINRLEQKIAKRRKSERDSKINYIIDMEQEKDDKLQAIADEMELPDSSGVMDLIDMLIDAEIERYEHETGK